ncbi:unnamed protein product [Urochloa decumbens]|uniref:Plant heme peroxidase family profile domain-containing protein n=1 Tax=Urochloa decumbens TaxID=240449 RepID=A0ABC8W8J3_9POAL
MGRRDSMTASLDAANNDIPTPTFDLSDLTKSFSNKGLSATDMIALSGGTLLGKLDVSISAVAYTVKVTLTHPLQHHSNQIVQIRLVTIISPPLNASTPYAFDNFYYKNLLNKKGVLHSDQQLFNGGSVDPQTTTYSSNMAKFFTDFSVAMVKMGNISPLTGSSGQIRKNCRKIN